MIPNIAIDLQIIFRMFLESGDSLLIEEYTYPHVPESMLYPLGIKTVPIRMDEKGMIPEALEESLATLQAKGKPIPKLLYTVPVGQNPTGKTLSVLLSRSCIIIVIIMRPS